MKIRKWTFINVLFSKSQNTFEKNITSSLLQRPPSPFRGPYLYALDDILCFISILTIMLWFVFSPKKCKRWSKSWESCFAEFLVGYFWGMFWIICFVNFSEMEHNSLQQMDGPKVVKAIFQNSWLDVFGGCFE